MLTNDDLNLLTQLTQLAPIGYPLCNNADIQLVESLVDIVRVQHQMLLRSKAFVDSIPNPDARIASLRIDLNDITLSN